MTLKDEILSNQACADAVARRDLDAIAAIVSEGRKAIQPRMVTARAILNECADGEPILNALELVAETNGTVKWAVRFLGTTEGLDVGAEKTQSMITQLVQTGALTADQGEQLRGMALKPAPVSRLDVEAALFHADGSEK